MNASPSANVISGPLANSYLASLASRKIAGNVKMNPVERESPVVADVAILT